tara:strand:+ start:1229 stop:2017 length:789 start_codon:yes stop_codon:yes gene_type:complete
MKPLKVLIACEESQAVTKEFRKLGHQAYSCDLLPCSGGHPEWHFQDDALEIADGWFDSNEVTISNTFDLKLDVFSGDEEFEYKEHRIRQIGWKWDLMIAHPPCTYLAVSGARWLYNKDGSKNEERLANQSEALDFVQKLMDAPINKIAIENPVSVISSNIRKPEQIIQPWMFGDKAQKTTCLWLKNLPLLEATDIVEKGEIIEFISKKGVKKRQPKWYLDALKKAKTTEERRTLRSKTFKGIAEAMAKQWTIENPCTQLNLF